ncbi:MAG: NUDIX domain-containing protein [Desulfobacterales bacterium]|nr:NUDIX domain-containing protein [Desulfobacterales bacterium]
MRDRTLCFLIRENPATEVLLGFKKVRFGAGKYAGFGGEVEPGETIAAAIRELEEETGVKVLEENLQRVGHLTFLFPAKPSWSQVVHVFQTTAWDGNAVESEEMMPVWFSVSEIPYEHM